MTRYLFSPNRRNTIGLTITVGPIALRQGPISASGARASPSESAGKRVGLRLFGENSLTRDENDVGNGAFAGRVELAVVGGMVDYFATDDHGRGAAAV